MGPFVIETTSAEKIVHRIVKDYEKYVSRQFKRGASRQELNVSWLKKNEMDLRRHVTELRDSVRNNWTTTGQELTKELRQYWTSSRPSSPAPRSTGEAGADGHSGSPLSSPTALTHKSHLAVPRPESPTGGSHRPSRDFAAGYSLGLIGGVRSWVARRLLLALCNKLTRDQMTRTPPSLRGNQHDSAGSEEDSPDSQSPRQEDRRITRGRKAQALKGTEDVEMAGTKA